ncbi:MAG: radical SAM family heme chaperone HemW [Chloroflexi bacterium]|nr:radical SAM family heme chaperone HemW [Chloroflexota bacterium]
MDIAIYIHIPFCERKCPYCDFNSFSGRQALRTAYVDALCHEMAAVAARGRALGASYAARTLYFGGGTPTLLDPRHFAQLLACAREQFGWHERLETTTEANPGTIDVAYLRALRALGVNRVSLGVQSLDDAMLRRLGRIHDASAAIAAVEACREGGFENLSVDLMYGLPDQDLPHWRRTLEQVAALAPEHLSLYPLTIEPGTPFWRRRESGRLILPPDDDVAEMFEVAEEALKANSFDHYELSNWALGMVHQCQHNLTYWRNQPYVGLGAGAHSSLHLERYHNVESPSDYIRLVGDRADAVASRESIDRNLEMAETLILGLRLADGVRRTAFRDRFGRNLDEVIGDALSRPGLDELIADDGERIALSPRGKLLANEVFVAVLDSSIGGPSVC